MCNHRVDVRKVGLDELGLEFNSLFSLAFHKHDVNDIVANVSFALNLK